MAQSSSDGDGAGQSSADVTRGSTPSAVPPALETPPAIESLSDLIARERRVASSSGRSPLSPQRGPGQTSSSPRAVSQAHPRSPSSGSVQTRTDAARGEVGRDERRWNGFHLWRQESANARADLVAGQDEASPKQEPPRSYGFHDLLHPVRAWFRQRRADGPGDTVDHDHASSRDTATRSALAHDGSEYSSSSSGSLAAGRHLSRRQLFTLTLSLAGAQMAWSLELAYGTPFLLSLGLSKEVTSLVWLAGPLSGLIAQPLIGALSDRSTSRFRRRAYMIGSAIVLSLSTLLLAFVEPVARSVISLLGSGLGDWDPARRDAEQKLTQGLAVASFWLLDFALNGLQAASRALILDIAPATQQSHANAWHGRMTHAGNVVGYACGWVDLGSWRGLSWLGGGQFRKFSVVSLAAMLVAVGVTCATTPEHAVQSPQGATTITGEQRGAPSLRSQAKETIDDIWTSIRRLPRPVRRVCAVQFFAFMGWFPFLFYATTYVAEAHAGRRIGDRGGEATASVDSGVTHALRDDFLSTLRTSADDAMQKGSFAMLLYALVALIAGTVLPYAALSSESRKPAVRLPGPERDLQASASSGRSTDVADDLEGSRSTASVRRSKRANSLLGRCWRGIVEGITLRTFWTLASVLFSLLMFATAFTSRNGTLATVNIALVGIPWAVASWAPFALVMEQVHEAEEGSSPFEFDTDFWGPRRTAERRRSVSRTWAPEEAKVRRREGSVGRRSSAARAQLESALRDCEPLRNNAASSGSSSRASISSPHRLRQGRRSTLGDDEAQGQLSQSPRGPSAEPTHAYESQSGGKVLGIHNLAIVLPQFVVSVISSFLFKLAAATGPAGHGGGVGGKGSSGGHPVDKGIEWVLHFGGAMALVAALLTRYVPLTQTERHKRGILPSRPHFDDEVSEEGEETEGSTPV